MIQWQASSWSNDNQLQLNPNKFKELRTSFKRSPLSYKPVTLDGLEFEQVSAAKGLGVTITQGLKWNDHISDITAKVAKLLYLLRQLTRAGVSSKDLMSL